MFWSPNAKPSGTNDDHSRWLSRDQLERCLQENGCLVCRALTRFERKDIHSFLYEGMMFPAVRRQFLAAGGFCHRHFWMAMKIEDDCWPAGGIGMAMLCEDLLRLASDALTRSAHPDARPPGMNRKGEELFRRGGACVFCKDSAEKEKVFMELLEELVEEPPFRNAVEAHGLCVWHGELATTRWRSEASRQWISTTEQEHICRMAETLREVIRKHDYRYRGEGLTQGKDSVLASIEMLVGG